MIEDLRSLEPNLEINTDLCIIGSGPAGLSIASEFAQSSIKVLILESGGVVEEPEIDALSLIDNIGAPRLEDPTKVRNRIFGGSSHTWSGRCTTFDEIDYEVRPWVPFSGWPIRPADVEPCLRRAADQLGILAGWQNNGFWLSAGRSPPNIDVNHDLLEPIIWQYSADETEPSDFMRFGRRFLSSKASNIRILLHATVCHITTNHYGSQLKSIDVTNLEGKTATIKAKVLILCGGGIENARLLLCSNRILPEGIGNKGGLVGRFLMDHARCEIGTFDIRKARTLHDKFGAYRALGHRFRQGLKLSDNAQKRMGLLNCAAWLDADDRLVDDAWDAVRRLRNRRQRRPVRHQLRDIWWVASQPDAIFEGVWNRLHGKSAPLKARRLLLQCDVEQAPNPDSRIRLSDRKDGLGLPLAQIDWRISEQEKASIAALGIHIKTEFQRLGLPSLTLADWIEPRRYDEVSFVDAAHPAGTTRMAHSARQGVVDPNCQIHDVDGIFIAGTSVFPTISHANPTLMLVALAVRLADWLKANIFRSATPSHPMTELADRR